MTLELYWLENCLYDDSGVVIYSPKMATVVVVVAYLVIQRRLVDFLAGQVDWIAKELELVDFGVDFAHPVPLFALRHADVAPVVC